MTTQTEAERLAQEFRPTMPYKVLLLWADDAATELRRLEAANTELLAALVKADEFIDGIREDLHHERTTDWYLEGANNAAQSMSESMRLIGNRCADFVVAGAAIAKHQPPKHKQESPS